MPNALHTIGGLHPDNGGPARSVPNLCRALANNTAIVLRLLSQKRVHDLIVEISASHIDLHIAESHSTLALKLGWPFRRLLHQQIQAQQPDVLHDHGLWLPSNHYAAEAARQYRIPLMIQPRGMLEPWAMNHKAWKKRLAWNLYQRRDLESAAVLHATAEQEAESFRQLGLRPPIAIIPNGTDLPEWRDRPYPKGTPRKMLFLSRIHQKKGLLELVQAWQIVKPTGWKMVIAGPDEGGHQKIVEAAIQQAGLQDDFEFTGSVYGDEKEALYRSAEVFVLPTFSENFGLVVAEALACGVPVITTKGAPWQGLHTHRCGWWIDIGVEPLVAALREATTLPPDALRAMGQRGRVYVEQNFGWPHIAQQMLSVYRWVLGRGERPDCVYLE